MHRKLECGMCTIEHETKFVLAHLFSKRETKAVIFVSLVQWCSLITDTLDVVWCVTLGI